MTSSIPTPGLPSGLFRPDDLRPDQGYPIRIDRDGTWYYHGSPIRRLELSRLFSTVLRRDEAGDYWLVTPAERGRIQVDEVPFTAVGLTVSGEGASQRLIFRTNLDAEVTAGPDHPIRVEEDDGTGEPRPYILVRDNLEARITRAVFYDLVERAETREDGEEVQVGIWSMGTFFPLGRPMNRAMGGLTVGDFTKERIRGLIPRFAANPSRTLNVRGDHDLNPGTGAPAQLRHAAVLVPLVERPDGMTIIFTQRTAHLAAHAGQISFPGGGMEPTDQDALACALRETSEEIGLAPERVEVAGRLDTYVTRTGFEITPVVGFVRPPFILNPDPFEVAEVFEVPLDFFLKPGAARKETRQFQGTQRFFYVFPYEHRYIWGATAGMLVNLVDVLHGRC